MLDDARVVGVVEESGCVSGQNDSERVGQEKGVGLCIGRVGR